MRRRAVVLLAIAFMACSGPSPGDGNDAAATEGQRAAVTRSHDSVAVLNDALESLRGHWREAEGADGPLRVLDGGLVLRAPDVRCDGDVVTPRDLDRNALYCPADDSVLIDLDGMADPVLRRRGPLGLALVLAHEAGHSLQRHQGAHLNPLVGELQADCYAGVFLAAVRDRDSSVWSATPGSLAQAAGALLDVGDVPGVEADATSAHGTGLDRVSALLDGYELGTPKCESYRVDPPAVTNQGFRSSDEALTRGQMPLSTLLDVAKRDLDLNNRYLGEGLSKIWVNGPGITFTTPTTCAGHVHFSTRFCDDGTVVVDRDRLEELAGVGDFAVLAVLARAWSAEAQRLWPDHLTPGAQATECLVGLWLGLRHPAADHSPDQQLFLSPGDLDDVVDALLQEPARTDPLGRVSSLLSGFRHGRTACERYSTGREPLPTMNDRRAG